MKTNLHFLPKLLMVTFIMIFASLRVFAFDYTIVFTGTGGSTSVETVEVQNLTKGSKVIVSNGNVLNLTDAPNAINQLNSNDDEISIYPNPIKGSAILSFSAKNAGNVQINVLGIDGKKIAGTAENLQSGENTFQISLPKGAFVIKVVGSGFSYTTKVICQTNSQNKTDISFIGIGRKQTTKQKSKSAVINMQYSTGDIVLYKGISSNYSTIVTDVPTESKTINFDFVECKDGEGNYYSVVKIGTQLWMAENLKTTKLNDGTTNIPNITDNGLWSSQTSAAYCDYSNTSSNGLIYGKLYNWYAASNNNLSPKGWHVPSDTEWSTLTTFLGGEATAGGKLKETSTTHWLSPNSGATNITGFTALPAGGRNFDGVFPANDFGVKANWWTSTENNTLLAWYSGIDTNNSFVARNFYNKAAGFSIRCLKDSETPINTESAITSFSLDLSSLDALADQTIKAGVTVEIVGEEIHINVPFGLKADTIASLLGSNAATVVVSDKATVSPASGTPVKFNVNTPIYYTVTAEDGVSKTAYKVRLFETAQQGYGVISEYWRKKGTAFTDKFTDNNEKTFALTPTHIIQQIGGLYGGNLKLVKLSMLDGTEAGYAKVVVAPGDTIKQVRAMGSDRKGAFIACNLAAPGADFKVWAWDNVDAAPRELIKWNVVGLTPVGVAPSWAGNHLGRRISIVGDLKTEAYIYTYANYTLDILRWKVTNGVAATSPEIIHYTPGGSMTRFELWSSVIGMGATETSDILVNSACSGSEVGILDGVTKQNKMFATAVATPKSIATYFEFNGIKYYAPLNVEAYATPHSVNARLYDYTTTNTSALMSDNWWLTPVPAKIEADGTLQNGDATGCIDAIVDADGQGFKVVALGTGSGIVVTQFSKKKEMTF